MGWFSSPKNVESSNDLIVTALNKSLAVIEFQPTGSIITANANFLSVMGYRLEEIQGQHHAIFVADDESKAQSTSSFGSAYETVNLFLTNSNVLVKVAKKSGFKQIHITRLLMVTAMSSKSSNLQPISPHRKS